MSSSDEDYEAPLDTCITTSVQPYQFEPLCTQEQEDDDSLSCENSDMENNDSEACSEEGSNGEADLNQSALDDLANWYV